MAEIDDNTQDVIQPRSEHPVMRILRSMLKNRPLSGKEKPMKVWRMRTEFQNLTLEKFRRFHRNARTEKDKSESKGKNLIF